MPVPDFADPSPPYVQIAADLRRRIASGEFEPGSRLPANAALRDEYRSANETVRRALGVLRDERLIETHSTRGTFVLRLPGPDAADDHGTPAQDVAALRDEVGSLRRLLGQAAPAHLAEAIARIEANLMDLYGKLGYEYPREDAASGPRRAHSEGNRRRGQRA